eukprot:SAG31_NODE_21_length_34109_cov_60.598824_34_plen_72_part_00
MSWFESFCVQAYQLAESEEALEEADTVAAAAAPRKARADAALKIATAAAAAAADELVAANQALAQVTKNNL